MSKLIAASATTATEYAPLASPPATSPAGASSHDIWIFGYGSLMWRPDFPYEIRARAVVEGYHRAFCIRSTHHRGTGQRPGLVLGLDRGRACTGIAYRISHASAPATLAYLRQRELIYGVYRETSVSARLSLDDATAGIGGAGHPTVQALAYTVERQHPSYVGTLPVARQASIIRSARGVSGNNLDYLFNTVRLLADLGIREPDIQRVAGLAGSVAARRSGGDDARPSVSALRKSLASVRPALQPLPISDLRRFGYRLRLASSKA